MKQQHLIQKLQHFVKDTRGNFAVIFGMLIIPVMAIIGGAIDFQRVFQAKQSLRACMESAALALPSMNIGANSTDDAVNIQLNQFMNNQPSCSRYLAGSANHGGVHAVFNAKIIRSGDTRGRINVSASATVDTTILRIMSLPFLNGGHSLDHIQIGGGIASSNPLEIEVQANTNVEISLVLDTTGSMGGRNMTALKSAVSILTNKLQSGDPDCSIGGSTPCKNVRMGMVPFAPRINIGTPKQCNGIFKDDACTSQTRARIPSWIDTSRLPWIAARKDWSASQCQGSARDFCSYANWNGDRSYYWNWRSRQRRCRRFRRRCNRAPVIPGHRDVDSWEGCVLSRYGDARFTDNRRYNGNSRDKVKAIPYACSIPKVQRITGDLTAINNKVQALSTGGSTNTAIGLAWGWRILSKGQNQGFDFDDTGSGNAEVKPYDDEEWKKVLIILTDGENTSSQKNGRDVRGGYWSNRQSPTLCTNMKNQDIKIFTIAFTNDSDAITLMKSCASKHSYYFNTTSIDGLQAAFSTIAKEISDLRIAK